MHQVNALRTSDCKLGVISIQRLNRNIMFLPLRYRKKEMINGVPIFRKYLRTFHRTKSPRALKNLTHKINRTADKIFNQYCKLHGVPDCIHAHDIAFGGAIGLYLKKRYNIPLVLTLHSSAFGLKVLPESWMEYAQTILDGANQITTVSQAMLKDVISAFTRIQNKTIVLPNTLDNELKYLEQQENHHIGKPFVFFSLGNLNVNKNHLLLLNAFANQFKGMNCILKIGGDGPLYPDLLSEVARLDIVEQVDFLGHLTREQVSNEMSQCDSFVLSSNYETFGVVIIEALLCGKPVVATACGGPNDIIHADNGLLVKVNDSADLANAMFTMYSTRSNYSDKQISNDAIANFGITSFVDKAMQVFNDVCEMHE
ncbi:MAG: glycosyltransferase [Gammaproteobacteria bacterium]|nr:glycosyltransferase [Gammaproteobacteria bacterium]